MLVLFQRTETIDIDDKNLLLELTFVDKIMAVKDIFTWNAEMLLDLPSNLSEYG